MLRAFAMLVLVALFASAALAAPLGVQVGAFREFERAEVVQEALEEAGYNSYFSEENGFKRVRIGPYESRAKAEAEVAALWPFLVARFGPEEFERPWVVVEDRRIENAPLAPEAPARIFADQGGGSVADAAGLIDYARGFLGLRYRWGGSTPDGFDCSGFTQHVFANAGLAIPRQAKNQFRVGDEIDADRLAPGDLVFFAISTRRLAMSGSRSK